jgi:uncharacterized protein YdhG (YjbR/CyaY superfamily)
MELQSVEAYLADQPEPQRSTLLAMRSSILRILPAAEETISYGMPTFKVDGTAVAGIAGFNAHCSYFPYGTEVLLRHRAELAAYDVAKGTLRIKADTPLPPALLRKLLTTRLELESAVSKSGKVRKFYDNGYVQSRGTMRDGRMHGAWSWYRKDGTLMRTGTFRLGEQTGVWRTFDRDGRLVKETRF